MTSSRALRYKCYIVYDILRQISDRLSGMLILASLSGVTCGVLPPGLSNIHYFSIVWDDKIRRIRLLGDLVP